MMVGLLDDEFTEVEAHYYRLVNLQPEQKTKNPFQEKAATGLGRVLPNTSQDC